MAVGESAMTLLSLYWRYFLFISQFLPAVGLFCVSLVRRKYFILRAVACVIVCFGLSLIWSEAANLNFFLRILRYFVLFGAVVASVFFSFKATAGTALFCATCGYALQHMAHIFSQPVMELLRSGSGILALNITGYFAIFAVLYVLVYFLCARSMRLGEKRIGQGVDLVLISLMVIFCVLVFGSVYGMDTSEKSFYVRFTYSAFDIMSCVFSLALMRAVFRRREMGEEMEGMKLLWEKEKQQYKMTKETIDLINIKCHDLKHEIRRLQLSGGDLSDSRLEEMEKLVSVYDSAVKTGNEVIDVVLADKGLYCEKSGIKLTCMIDGKRFSHIEPSDLYSIFSNIMDNAITAVENVSEKENRVIALSSSESMGLLFLHAENYNEGSIDFEGDITVTKGDRQYHGFGTRSIVYIAQKYGGQAKFTTSKNSFSVDIVLPLSCGKDDGGKGI